MVSVFLIHITSLMSLPALSDSRSITLAFAQSITWFPLQTWSVIADLLQILAALVFAALVKIPVILSTSLQCFLLLLPVAFLFFQHRHVHSFYTVSYKPPLAFRRHWFCLWGAPADFSMYTVSQKKGATLTMAITLLILDRFAKFFHCCKEQ